MLDLNHPMSKHIFRASGLLDGLLVRGQRMSVSPSAERLKLLAECLPLFDVSGVELGEFGAVLRAGRG